MNHEEKIYNYIINEYGSRNEWISDISTKLNISRKEANTLTIAAGFVRGKRDRQVSKDAFVSNHEVISIVAGIAIDVLNRI